MNEIHRYNIPNPGIFYRIDIMTVTQEYLFKCQQFNQKSMKLLNITKV